MSLLDLVEKPLLIKKSAVFEEIKQNILTALSKIKIDKLSPSNIELIHYIALLIESIVDKNSQIDKLTLFNEIIKTLFPEVTDLELQEAEKTIDFLLSNKLIKKIPILKKALHYSFEILKKIVKI